MKLAINEIDKAILKIYQIHSGLRIEDFIVQSEQLPHLQGALLVKEQNEEDIEIAIHLNPSIQNQLLSYSEWSEKKVWKIEEKNAFSVAAEEISHFRFFVFKAEQNIKVSQLELEIQGEIDKFVLFFFSKNQKSFQTSFQSVFEDFHLQAHLKPEELKRYESANEIAKKQILFLKSYFENPAHHETLLNFLRHYYRLPFNKKLDFVSLASFLKR